MADRSAIEWTDATWNPVRGCTRVSEGCRNCYAEAVAARFSGPGLAYDGLATREGGKPRWTGKLSFGHDLEAPLRWRRPRRIFVNSMSDLFHEDMPDAEIDRVFAVMALCRQHTFQVLTKRPARMREYISALVDTFHASVDSMDDRFGEACYELIGEIGYAIFEKVDWPLSNVWLGTSCEDQATADARVPELLAMPAAVRFVSAEPLLGSIDFETIWLRRDGELPTALSVALGDYIQPLRGNFTDSPRLDWIIVGGESGCGARPMHPAWARAIRDQCAAAGVPFFFKQWGEWQPRAWCRDGGTHAMRASATISFQQIQSHPDSWERVGAGEDWSAFARLGKKAAGRPLDGVTHNAVPTDHFREPADA